MKKQLFLLAAILAMASSSPAWAYDFSAVAPSGQTLYYNIVSGHAEVVRPGTGSTYNNYVTGNLVIPASVTYNGTAYPVTALATISTMGYYGSFQGCGGLTSVTIPNSVTSIGFYAFRGCTGLTSVTIPNSVTSIGRYAFDGVRHIEYYGSATGSPWGAQSMNGVLDGDFVYSDTTKHHLIRYVGNGGNVTVPNSVTSIGNSAFSGCTGLTSVNIPNSVTSIGNSAFSGCTGLTSVNIPNSVTSIGNSAFYGCSGLTSVTISDGVTTIGDSAFYSCSGLTSVSIPTNVTSIGGLAFADCTGLTSVAFNADSCVYSGSWNDHYYSDEVNRTVFKGCSNITSFTFGNSVKYIPAFLCLSISHLTSVTIGSGVTSIGNYAFHDCTSLTSTIYTGTIAQWCGISFGNYSANPLKRSHSLTIGGSEVTNLVIPNGVTEIKQYAFSGCTGLTSVTIPNSVTSIGSSAFSDCSGLTSVTIGNSVTSIGDYAFRYCSGLTSFTMGSGVTSIGVRALGDCTGLRNIISKAVYPPTASDNTFENVPPYCTLTVPCGSLQYYQVTPLWNTQFPLMEEDCNPDGIDDTEIEDVMVYAANGMIYISSTLPTETTIFDITGHQVASVTAEAASIPLPAGVYLVKVGAYPARKVVVIR